MLHPGIEPSDGLFFRTFRVLLLFLLIILPSPSTAAELICSHQPIVAQVGDDVILPCHLEPAVSADSEKVVWTRPDLFPKYIHYHQDGRLNFDHQNPDYHLRTRLFMDELQKGNVSMKIFRVKISDAGKYVCILESLQTEASIQLTVAVVSTPVIEVVSNNNSDRPVLQCDSGGWYPEPEVLWLDSEGNLLPAGRTETVRGLDGLYNVSSRLTVEKSHSKSVTCRVHQKNIKQIRETHVHVPAGSLTVQTSYVSMTFSIIAIVCSVAAICYVFRCHEVEKRIGEISMKFRKQTNLVEQSQCEQDA